MFGVLLLVSVLTAVLLAVRKKNARTDPWYLQPTIRDSYYNPNKAAVAGIISFLYGYFIPIALYVSLEIVRVIQAQFITADIHMYDPVTNKAAKVKSAGLNEELGQVDTIFSDKTGTLTCNQMDFFRVSIAGVAYGIGTTEVERAAKQIGLALGGGPSPRDPKDNLLQFSSDKKAELQGSINMMDHNNNYGPDKTLTERKVSTFMIHDCLAAIGLTNHLLKIFNSLCRFLLYVTRLFLMEFQRIRLRCVTGLNRLMRQLRS
jgi:magnesium-transporting ATPase (P-type)